MKVRAPKANQWMGASAAREALRVGLTRLYRGIDTGKIPAYRMGRVSRMGRIIWVRRVDVERVRFVLDLELEQPPHQG